MKKLNLYKIGLSLGLIPIIGLSIILFIFWFGLTFFAYDLDVDGIGFLYIMASVPIVFVGFILTFISIFKHNIKTVYKPILGLLLITLNIPALMWILRTHGEVSSRAYLKVINNSENNIANLLIKEPVHQREFGALKSKDSKIVFYNPDYASFNGIQYGGISENFLEMKINDSTTKKRLPIIHPGETHKIFINDQLSLSDVHTNKIVFNK
ncbi:MAG: hypothetical protein JJE25_12415 [Bacteroidia bacterium]|nr:hypothetical protein [Bacteroidia bacterium]